MKWYYWIRMMYYKSMMDLATRHEEILDYYNKYIRSKTKLLRKKRKIDK